MKYFVLSVLLILITELTKSILNYNQLLYNSLAENLTSKQIDYFFELQNKWKWVSYFFIPIYILIKTSLIASTVYVGVFFFSKKEIAFKSILDIIFKAEFIFLLVPIFKITWFSLFQTSYTLENIQYFYPLSLLNITGYSGVDLWFIYPLQVINLFELAYIIYLSYQIGNVTETNGDNGLKIMAYTYVPMMFLWIAVVMFFTLNNN